MTAIQANQTNMIAHSDILSAGVASSGSLTAEALLHYLASRLDSIDTQINTIMAKQRATENARKHAGEIMTILNGKEPGDKLTKEEQRAINEHLQAIGDPKLANKLAEDLGVPLTKIYVNDADGKKVCISDEDAPYEFTDHRYKGRKLSETDIESYKTIIENTTKDLESSAQLDMIQLQSLMSARNTAISLATNMMSAVGKGLESIVANVGR